MFIINDRLDDTDHDLIELLKKVEPATIGHFKHSGFIDPAIRPLFKGCKIVGPAVTVKTPGADSTVVHKVMEIAQAGDVVVIDRCGDTLHACLGGGVALAAYCRGLAGAIVDGPCTDVDEIEELGLPVYGRGLTAITTKLLGFGGEINTAISCGGVTVHPGDLIVADDNGIVVLRPQEALHVAEKAIAMQEREVGLLNDLKAGKNLPDLTKANQLIRQSMEK